MEPDPRTAPLKEWNRLARENTENAVVSSMFEAAGKASEPIDAFCTWLLAGAAAIASFLIVNAEKIIPVIGKTGFLVCGLFLCLSCILGLLSKMFALRCKVAAETGEATRKTFNEHYAAYVAEEEKILEGAKFWGISLETGIRIERVLSEFLAPMPFLVKWQANRYFRKNSGNPQIAHLSHIKSLNAQGVLAFLQAISFLGFLSSGFVFASAI